MNNVAVNAHLVEGLLRGADRGGRAKQELSKQGVFVHFFFSFIF